MIRRELPDGTILMIPQENHADVSAQFAAHWGNGTFARPEPYQSVVFGTVYHDSGHREVEAAVPVDVELGRLYGMRDMPAAAKREDANQANVSWIAGRDPYAGLLTAMHRTGLRKKRYGTVSTSERDYAASEGDQLGMEAAFADLDESLREHLGSLNAQELNDLWFNYQLLQVYDLLSLYVCCDGYANGSLRDSTLTGVPVAYGRSDETDMSITPTGSSSVRIDPYPFDAAPLTVSVLARHMTPVAATSEADVREAYHRSPRELFSWQFTT